MKLSELNNKQQLDEISLKQALAGATLAATLSTGAGHYSDEAPKQKTHLSVKQEHELAYNKEISNLTNIILDKYKIAPEQAKKIAILAKKYENNVFPKAIDLLAVIGIESSFDSNAKSNLKHDKAIGLTQIRPKVWGIEASTLKNDIDKQVSLSADILSKYYHKLGNKDSAIHAYNVGITNFRNKTGLNPEYVQKWKNELKRYI